MAHIIHDLHDDDEIMHAWDAYRRGDITHVAMREREQRAMTERSMKRCETQGCTRAGTVYHAQKLLCAPCYFTAKRRRA